MDGWLSYLIALGALLVLAPLAAWLGRKRGRQIKGAAGLALIMLGFGQAFDPPARHAIEAISEDPDEGDATGEPKDPHHSH